MSCPVSVVAENVRYALAEDVGSGDITAELIDPRSIARADVLTRDAAILCGCAWFDETFRQIDASLDIKWLAGDGDAIKAGAIVCSVAGKARSLLTGERTALNFLQLLSGVATRTREYVDAVSGTKCVILDTRKTLPGLRHAQKYAVTCGGGRNHRMGLYDAMLIKENHITAAGSVTAAIDSATARAKGRPVEIEVENLDQLREALAGGAKRILLDNFEPAQVVQAAQISGGRAGLEVSGGITRQNIRAYAEAGADFISIGDVTKNVKAVDFSFRLTRR